MKENICLKCVHLNVCRVFEPYERSSCNHFLSNDAFSQTETAKRIISDIEINVTEIYNKHIFGCYDLDDTEKEAVMNFSVDLGVMLDRIAEKYTGKRLDEPEI